MQKAIAEDIMGSISSAAWDTSDKNTQIILLE